MSKEKYYITTAIAYTSRKPHIGNSYEIVLTDAIARYKRMQGYDVFFLTGTDEHGQKIEEKAKAAGVTPQQFVDNIVTGPKGVLDLWKLMNISNDRFIRTTDDYHVAAIQRIFHKKTAISIKAPTRVNTARRARASGPRASSWTASAPTAAARSTTRRRRPISSVFPSMPIACASS